MKTIFLFLLLTLGHFVHGQSGMGTIQGTLIDENSEFVPFGRVMVYSGEPSSETFVAGGQSDFDGNFRINSVIAGDYNLVIIDYVSGMDTLYIDGVKVTADAITFLGEMRMTTNREIIGCDFGLKRELIKLPDPFNGTIIEPEDIRRP